MGRWEPNARERLVDAAMELFQERGYARTTVEEIAARAGLTERTFFRYYTDKREVLFSGSKGLEELLVATIASAPLEKTPFEAVLLALESTSSFFEGRREFAGKRHLLIEAHPELRERELNKMSSLATAIGETLRKRGSAETEANLAAEVGIVIFKLAFEAWVKDQKQLEFVCHVRAMRDQVARLIQAEKSAS